MGDIRRKVKGGKFLGWYIRWYENGRRYERASKQPTAAGARRMLVEIEARVARNEMGIPEPKPDYPTVSVLIDRFLAEYDSPRLKSQATYLSKAKYMLADLGRMYGKLRTDSLEPSHMVRLRSALAARLHSNTIRTTFAQIGTLFSWGLRVGLCPTNPVKGLALPRREDALEYLTADEVAMLLRVAAAHAAAGDLGAKLEHVRIATAIYTGLRKGELCGLRWRDLDLKSGRLTVARSYRTTPKSGKTRHLRLPDVLVPLLAEWQPLCPQTADGLVFPVCGKGVWGMAPHTSVTGALPALLAEAGCRPNPRPWHLLRHTFASHFMMSGGSLLTLSKILGHADLKITMVYAHLAPDFIGQEMNRIKFNPSGTGDA